jgi:hypothetical protein
MLKTLHPFVIRSTGKSGPLGFPTLMLTLMNLVQEDDGGTGMPVLVRGVDAMVAVVVVVGVPQSAMTNGGHNSYELITTALEKVLQQQWVFVFDGQNYWHLFSFLEKLSMQGDLR